MMAAFNKHVDRETYADASAQEMRTGARQKETLHFDGEDGGLPALGCIRSCALVRVREGTSSMAVSLNREPGLEHQQPRNALTDYYLMPRRRRKAVSFLASVMSK
jgi:hypothetical protein